MGIRLLLDEHVGRVFERVLRERRHTVEQANDLFGERTKDTHLLECCGDNSIVLLSNNEKGFEPLHRECIVPGYSSTTVSTVRIQIPKGLSGQ